jgi:Tautomerase enzyme
MATTSSPTDGFSESTEAMISFRCRFSGLPTKRSMPKLAMYKRIVDRPGINPGVRPEGVLISVTETAAQNWSFGNGETQFYKPSERQGPLST